MCYARACTPSSDKLGGTENGELYVRLQKMEPGRAWTALLLSHALPLTAADSDRKRLVLENYQRDNPGFDFSGAEVSGSLPETGAWRA